MLLLHLEKYFNKIIIYSLSISHSGLLQELTEPSTLAETEVAMKLIDAFVSLQGVELIIQNLSRLDEKNEVSIKVSYIFFIRYLHFL